jgi:hypothetical protein
MKYLDTKAESLENKITQIFGETVAKEGNKFTKALNAARENGKNYFEVDGKQFKTEDYQEDNTNDKSDDGKGLDKVQPKAVKKKFDDRKDKDIDNDGDVDSSDKFLHKRRKAISKAVKKEWIEADGSARRVSEGDKRKKMEKVSEDKKSIVDIQQEKNQSMREMLAKIWGVEEGKSPFMPQESKKPMKSAKTESGEKATKVEVNPELQQPGSTVTTPDR